MTRENKLALVVGFGLILFVGILISDHFSVVRSQHAADLTTKQIDDPLLVAANLQNNLIDLSDPKPQAPAEPELAPITESATPKIIQGQGTIGNPSNTEVTPLGANGTVE